MLAADTPGVISQSTFTLWSTLSVLDGVHGLERTALPDSMPGPLGFSYFALSRVVFSLFALVLAIFAFRRKTEDPGSALALTAAYAVAVVLLLTRASPRYLYFGLMFATAGLPWMSQRVAISVISILTGTMLVSMWGMLALTGVWYPDVLPVFDPNRSWLNAATVAILGNDVGITICGLFNLTA
jgi:hypothetical protein